MSLWKHHCAKPHVPKEHHLHHGHLGKDTQVYSLSKGPGVTLGQSATRSDHYREKHWAQHLQIPRPCGQCCKAGVGPTCMCWEGPFKFPVRKKQHTLHVSGRDKVKRKETLSTCFWFEQFEAWPFINAFVAKPNTWEILHCKGFKAVPFICSELLTEACTWEGSWQNRWANCWENVLPTVLSTEFQESFNKLTQNGSLFF